MECGHLDGLWLFGLYTKTEKKKTLLDLLWAPCNGEMKCTYQYGRSFLKI